MQSIALPFSRGDRGQHSTVAARAMEATCRQIIEETGDGVLVIDAATKQILDANNAIQRLAGKGLEEMQLMTLHGLFQAAGAADRLAIAQLLVGGPTPNRGSVDVRPGWGNPPRRDQPHRC